MNISLSTRVTNLSKPHFRKFKTFGGWQTIQVHWFKVLLEVNYGYPKDKK